jgi:hypothetical protein
LISEHPTKYPSLGYVLHDALIPKQFFQGVAPVYCEWLSNGVKIRKNNIKRNIFIVFLNLKKINGSLKKCLICYY